MVWYGTILLSLHKYGAFLLRYIPIVHTTETPVNPSNDTTCMPLATTLSMVLAQQHCYREKAQAAIVESLKCSCIIKRELPFAKEV